MAAVLSSSVSAAAKFEQKPQQNGHVHHQHQQHLESMVVIGGEHFALIEDDAKPKLNGAQHKGAIPSAENERAEKLGSEEIADEEGKQFEDEQEEEGEGEEAMGERKPSKSVHIENGPYSAFVLSEREELELRDGIAKILQEGKGILTADERDESIGLRLEACELQNTLMYRRRFRQLLFSTPNLSKHISAVVMSDETYKQSTDRGDRLVDLLRIQGVAVGVKMDTGAVPLIPVPHPSWLDGEWRGETLTQGLDNIAQRAEQYKRSGCTFAKWRSGFYISENTPSQMALEQNAMGMARFAMICQRYGLVPLIEPDVCSDGSHTIEEFKKATEAVFSHVVKALIAHGIFLEGVIIKMNMIAAGPEAPEQPTAEQVAQQTLNTLHKCIPTAVPGIAFRSGGLGGLCATQNLSALNKYAGPTGTNKKPWQLTFCFGHDLQANVMEIWRGCSENVGASQKEFLHRARASSEAERGTYESEEAVAIALSGVTFTSGPTRYY